MNAGDGVYARQVSLDVSSTEYKNVNTINGDEPIVFSLIGKVAEFILKSNDDRELSQVFRHLKARPISLEKCKAIKQIIDSSHPLIMVVDDEINRHEASKSIMITWERSLDIDDEQVLALMGKDGIAAAKQSKRTSIDILTISKLSMKALKRLTETLERPVYRPIVLTPAPTYKTPLFEAYPSQKKRGCDCTIV